MRNILIGVVSSAAIGAALLATAAPALADNVNWYQATMAPSAMTILAPGPTALAGRALAGSSPITGLESRLRLQWPRLRLQ